MVAEAGLGEGPLDGGPQGGPVLHALRHGALLPRAGPRLQGRGRPVRLREVPAAGRARRVAARLDHDAVDARASRRDRRGPGGDLRPGPPRRRHAHPRGGARGARARRGRGGGRHDEGLGAPRTALRASVPVHHGLRRARPHRPRGGLRVGGGRDRGRSHRRGLRRGRLQARDRERPDHPEPGPPERQLRRQRRPVRGHAREGGRPAHRRGAPGVREALPRGRVRALLPALLALRHAPHLLREERLVRPDDRDEGRAARGQRDDRLAPRAHQARPLRQLAREQRRLGALARALLGHAAAGVALRRGPPRLRRLAGGDRRAWRRASGGRAPAVHRRGGAAARTAAARCAGSRT